MSDVRFGGILPQIHQLFAAGSNAGLSDGVLLRRYCTQRDESAFATLVGRHGAMVLTVCRNVLRSEIDAEDAFQAVFLILVRKAGSIRVDDSLGGWLHGVAYRVAVRASEQAARRGTRERDGLETRDWADSTASPASDPRLAALHEEIARLPGSQRQALVLCWLEGKTQVEAAQEIGCGEATVRRRVADARERLKERLDSRHQIGDAAPALLALPTRLAESTLAVAAGPLNALAASILNEMKVAHLARVGLMGCLVVAAVAGGIILAARRSTPDLPPMQQPAAEPMPVADAGEIKTALDPGDFHVLGKVVGPDGGPVAGAVIYLRAFGVQVPARKAVTDASGTFQFQTKRELGIKMTETAPNHYVGGPFPDEEEIRHVKPRIVAVAPGFGFGLLEPGDGVTLKLTADEPISGRVTDRDGKPVSGADVRVRNIYWPKHADDPLNVLSHFYRPEPQGDKAPEGPATLDPWLATVKSAAHLPDLTRATAQSLSALANSLGDIPAAHAPIVHPVKTDADGRFKLIGLGKERVGELIIDGKPGFASNLLLAASRPIDQSLRVPGEPQKTKGLIANPSADVLIFGNRADVVLEPGCDVEGTVSDPASHLPLRGVRVIGPWINRLEYPEFDRFHATTDAFGHYRISGLPLRKDLDFTFRAPEKSAYIGREVDVDTRDAGALKQVDVALPKGVWITGKVVDDATGAPIPDASIEYHVFNNNPFLRKDLEAKVFPDFDDHLRANGEGEFRIIAYPGRGIVAAFYSGYLNGIGAEKIAGLGPKEFAETLFSTKGFSPSIRSTIIEVNVPEGAQDYTCELRLKKGKSRQVRVVGVEGKPRFGFEASGLAGQIENPMTKVESDRFTVTNLFPGERRAVIARIAKEKLTGTVEVPADDTTPITLKLQPWATLKGRLVDDAGKPLFKAIDIELEDGKLPIHTFNGRNYDREEFSVSPDGTFELIGLVPGATYRLYAILGNAQVLGYVTAAFELKPGEIRELGDVHVITKK